MELWGNTPDARALQSILTELGVSGSPQLRPLLDYNWWGTSSPAHEKLYEMAMDTRRMNVSVEVMDGPALVTTCVDTRLPDPIGFKHLVQRPYYARTPSGQLTHETTGAMVMTAEKKGTKEALFSGHQDCAVGYLSSDEVWAYYGDAVEPFTDVWSAMVNSLFRRVSDPRIPDGFTIIVGVRLLMGRIIPVAAIPSCGPAEQRVSQVRTLFEGVDFESADAVMSAVNAFVPHRGVGQQDRGFQGITS